MRVRSWKLKTVGKVIVAFSAFLVLILLLNHSYTRKLLSAKPLGNFEPRFVTSRGGAGEQGRAHYTRESQLPEVRKSLAHYGINMVCSSEISLSRSLPDVRLPECKYLQYSEDLPSASVIVIFYNEGLSVLLRNINSILNRTPRKILEEIILVDDFSDKPDLKQNLEMQVVKFSGVVKLIRHTERQGLIRARITGANHARGRVLVYLDAHCEVNVNWLPPLLEPIKYDRKVVTIPVIDAIDKDTFEYTGNYDYQKPSKGIFSWGLLNKEIELSYHEKALLASRTTPYRTATHQGGLFAIEKAYFAELGHYDEDLLVWGGENLELSFKVWQCGGRMFWVPCSRVGHVFRSVGNGRLGAYQPPRNAYVTSNFRRVVEVWLDDKYKEYYYTMEPYARLVDMGNISKQLELKRRLRCNTFGWYMEYVARDVYRHFPPPPVNAHWGELVNIATSECVDQVKHVVPSELTMRRCNQQGPGQIIRLNTMGQLAKGERCIVASGGTSVQLVACPLGRTDGAWRYEERDTLLINGDTHKCLGQHPMTKRLMLLPCDTRNTYLQWIFGVIRR